MTCHLTHDVLGESTRLTGSSDFDGYRGAPPADRNALMLLLQRLSAIVEEVPELYEMDLNPVKVLTPGGGAIVVDARVRIGPATATTLTT